GRNFSVGFFFGTRISACYPHTAARTSYPKRHCFIRNCTGIWEHTPAQVVTHTMPSSPSSRASKMKVDGPKFEASRRQHPAGLIFVPHPQTVPEQPASGGPPFLWLSRAFLTLGVL